MAVSSRAWIGCPLRLLDLATSPRYHTGYDCKLRDWSSRGCDDDLCESTVEVPMASAEH